MAAGAGALVGVSLGWWGALAVAGVGLAAVLPLRRRSLAAVYAVAVIAALCGAWRGAAGLAATPPDAASRLAGLASVVTAPVATGQRQHFVVAPPGHRADAASAYPMRICVTTGAVPTVRLGDAVRLDGAVQAGADVAMAWRSAMIGRDCDATMFSPAVEVASSLPSAARSLADIRLRLGQVLRRSVPGDAGVLLTGLVTGDDAALSPPTASAFEWTGTTHLTAVSGSNLALVAGILATIGGVTFGRHRIVWQLLTVAVVWSYALISGAQPPAMRAVVVVSAAILAFRFGRRPDFPTLILLAAGAMALIEPRQVEALGFRLSVASSLALALVLPAFLTAERLSPIAAVIAATTAAQVATIPLLLPVFGAVSLSSLPANLVAAPLVAAAMPLAALAAISGLVWLPLAEVIAAPAAFLATLLIQVVGALGTSRSYVRLGVPPTDVALVVAVAGALILLAIGGDARRSLARLARRERVFEEAGGFQLGAGSGRGALVSSPRVSMAAVYGTELAAAALSLSREDPLDAFAPHAEDAVEDPARQHHRHQVADDRQR
jgi:competence protein ComEC